ncbi:hypothetical protein [Dyella sp. 20L07]|uniref:hypothetical protein n=1 Tax=Dyella sp. 20L07 TaxID=3384240 RepID=UPI003D2ACF97
MSAFSATAFAGTPSGNESQASSSDTVPSDADLAKTKCMSGEEKFLPGDYFYCLATQTYGQGHIKESQHFFETAAGWASKPAQYVLGIMALNGDHQPVNRSLGLAWLTLASERAGSSFKQAYETTYGSATADERKQAEVLLGTMRPVYGDAIAAPRAEKRYAEGMAHMADVSTRAGLYCMADSDNLAGADENTPNCVSAQVMVKVIDTAAVNVFDGWTGHVHVGALEEVSHPPAHSN